MMVQWNNLGVQRYIEYTFTFSIKTTTTKISIFRHIDLIRNVVVTVYPTIDSAVEEGSIRWSDFDPISSEPVDIWQSDISGDRWSWFEFKISAVSNVSTFK